MFFRNPAYFPQRLLQSRRQALKRLGKTNHHAFPVRIGQCELVDQVIEQLPVNRDADAVHVCEVGLPLPARLMLLDKHDFLGQPITCSPDFDPSLQCPKLAFLISLRMFPAQILKNGFCLDCLVSLQNLQNLWPYLLERILPRSPRPLPSGLARDFGDSGTRRGRRGKNRF